MSKLPELRIGDLKIWPPIIQGGMGVKVSMSKLASAVANMGCVGTISATAVGNKSDVVESIAEVTEETKKARAMSKKGIIAVNIMVALTSYPALVQAVKDMVDIIVSGAGLPLNLPKLVEGSQVKLIPIVSSGRTAEIISKVWTRKYNRIPDAFVLEGPLAGGHLGYSPDELKDDASMPRLESLLADVLAVADKYGKKYGRKIPVIAAGGIYDGKDIAHIIRSGASGVQMATRFVCTHECDVAPEFKQVYINAKKEDVVIINSPVGLPGRAVNNEFLEKARKGEIKFQCNNLCLKTCNPAKSSYCIADALISAAKGDLKNGFAFAGYNVYKIDKIVSVKELIEELVAEAEACF